MVINIKQNKEIRDKNYYRVINKMIQSYIKNPKGSLDLENANINRLPSNLKYVDGYLDISNTKITKLPKGLVIKDALYMDYTNISELPDGLVLGELWCRGSLLKQLPDDIIIKNYLYCSHSKLLMKFNMNELKIKYNIREICY